MTQGKWVEKWYVKKQDFRHISCDTDVAEQWIKGNSPFGCLRYPQAYKSLGDRFYFKIECLKGGYTL